MTLTLGVTQHTRGWRTAMMSVMAVSQFIDWKAIEEGSGLSAWDQLGEKYKMEATIGMLSFKPLSTISSFTL